ncbi:hypothetical protein DPMN_073246 [Dreissena polymorpha]|uniref:Uncharacterized protein n=1 Tax=Dreissena polymorpha TaxID=45954 RepID=A0A9D4BYR3_DREPO|nr:hypothetical protein DPMN_073246 [Dreissena polymorpha]
MYSWFNIFNMSENFAKEKQLIEIQINRVLVWRLECRENILVEELLTQSVSGGLQPCVIQYSFLLSQSVLVAAICLSSFQHIRPSSR